MATTDVDGSSLLTTKSVGLVWFIGRRQPGSESAMLTLAVNYFASVWVPACVCMSVSLSVCLSARIIISKTTRPNFTKFSVGLGLHVTGDRDSVLLRLAMRFCG